MATTTRTSFFTGLIILVVAVAVVGGLMYTHFKKSNAENQEVVTFKTEQPKDDTNKRPVQQGLSPSNQVYLSPPDQYELEMPCAAGLILGRVITDLVDQEGRPMKGCEVCTEKGNPNVEEIQNI